MHYDAPPPYYTVRLDDGSERSTVRARLATSEERAASAEVRAAPAAAAAAPLNALQGLLKEWQADRSLNALWSIRHAMMSNIMPIEFWTSPAATSALGQIRTICDEDMASSHQHAKEELRVALRVLEHHVVPAALKSSGAKMCPSCLLPLSDGPGKKGHCSSSNGRRCQKRARAEAKMCPSCLLPLSDGPGKKGHCSSSNGRHCQKRAEETWALHALGLVASEANQRTEPPAVLIFGPPGSGKSYTWRHLLWRLEKWLGASSVGRTAPYGIVAQNAGGCTLHTWAGLGDGTGTVQEIVEGMTSQQRQRWFQARVLGIDDVSPLDSETFEKAEEVARRIKREQTGRDMFFGGLLLVLNFDLAQLAPVKGKPLWLSQWWPRLTMPEHAKLVYCQHNRRFGTIWKEVVNRVRDNTISEVDIQLLQGILSKPLPADLGPTVRLVPRHDLARAFVEDRLAALGEAESHWYHAWYTLSGDGVWWSSGEAKLQIKVGVKVLYTQNAGRLANGTMGLAHGFSLVHGIIWPVVVWHPVGRTPFKTTVIPLPSRSPTDTLADGSLRYRLPLILAESLSIHKSLGMTIPAGEFECNGIWDKAQVYEAISRFPEADYVCVHNFEQACVKAPKASLKEMQRLQELAASQGFDLQSELASSQDHWQQQDESIATAEKDGRDGPQCTLSGTTTFIRLVFAGVASGASYYDPGHAAGECAPLTIIRVLQLVRKPLVPTVKAIVQGHRLHELLDMTWQLALASNKNDSTLQQDALHQDEAWGCACLRAVMAALAAKQGLGHQFSRITQCGKPVPLGAVGSLLEAAGITVCIVPVLRSGTPQCALYEPTAAGFGQCGGPGIVLLYCLDRTHLSLMSWADGAQAARFLTASSLPEPLQKLDRDGARLVANGDPPNEQPLTVMQWCSPSSPIDDALQVDAKGLIGGSGKVELAHIPAAMSATWSNGRPYGAVELQFHGGMLLSMDVERPTAADFEQHPTLVHPGYLWPRADSSSGRRMIGVKLAPHNGMPTLDRVYVVVSGMRHCVELHTSKTSHQDQPYQGNPPILPLAASGGRLEYGYYYGEKCTLALVEDTGDGSIVFEGSVAGVPNLPFLRNGEGQWSKEGCVRQVLCGTWAGGKMLQHGNRERITCIQHLDTVQLSTAITSNSVPTVKVKLPSSMESMFGAALAVAASADDTVGEVKARVSAVTGVDISQLSLSFGAAAPSVDSTTLGGMGVPDLGVLALSISGSVPAVTFAIKVELPESLQAAHGSMLTLVIAVSSSIGALKGTLESTLGVPAAQQVLTFNGTPLAPDSAALSSVSARNTELEFAAECADCCLTFSTKTRPKKQLGAAQSNSQYAHECNMRTQNVSSEWSWSQKRQRKDKDDSNGDMDVDMEFGEDFDEFVQQAHEEAGVAAEVMHVAILGRQGSMVIAATRSNLNISTLDSAGASSAYCMVHYCQDFPLKSRCFSERCCEP